MKKLIGVIILVFLPIVFTGCALGKKITNTAAEAGKDAGTIINKETGITDIGIKNAAELSFAKARAKEFYNSFKMQGEDLSNGPCLSDSLTTGWVADLVHNPRQPVDDEFKNQCPSYVSGKVTHFVELDLDGSFVRGQ
ncbi:MAG: hypothetical protein WCT08_04055 [Patescibacteria group bacterium]|jgi:hypothetical protein